MAAASVICAGLPRERLVHLPTPLEAAPRLSAALGVEVLIKREDLAGLCVGGNKSRLLEFVLGALRAEGVDTLIAAAAVQSNKLRDIAAAAARCGMHAVVLLPEGPGDRPAQGNRLLLDLLGAEVRHIEAGLSAAEVLARQEQVRGELEACGRRAVVLDRALDYGVQATLAYVDAAEELDGQLRERAVSPARVYITVGAGMTVAGLAFGLKLLGASARVQGICVAGPASQLRAEVCRHASRAAQHLQRSERLEAADLDLRDEYLAPGYGIVTPAVRAAVRTVARLHGMVLDPIYNARTAAALIDDASGGVLPRGASVVLVNTGGAPGIYPQHLALQGDPRD